MIDFNMYDDRQMKALNQILALGQCDINSTIAQEDDYEGWLKDRQNGIGGSDIAAICGQSDWSSPRDIYLAKTQPADTSYQSEPARWGNVLEQSIAAEWAKRNNRDYVHLPINFKSIMYPFANANVDGFTLDKDGNVDGILEIKTTSAYNQEKWEVGPLPIYYLYQIQWYLMVTGLKKATIVCLVGGQRLFEHEFVAIPDIQQDMLTKGHNFWYNHVLRLEEPELTDIDSDKVGKGETIPTENPLEPFIIQDDEYEKKIEMYLELNKKVTELEKIKKALYNNIFEGLQQHEEAITTMRTLKIQKQNRKYCDFDILSKYPDVYNEAVYTKEIQILKIK